MTRPETATRTARSVVLACSLALAWSLAPGSHGAAQEPLQQRLDRVFAEWDRPDSPGCALGVYREGEIVYTRGYGMANLEHRAPITPSSIFHVASVSKQFAAMAMALLEQRGALSLDDDIRTHIPELPDFGHTITIRHLIHHTSGLRDQWALLSLAGWRADDLKTEDDVLELVKRQRELNFPPGSEHLYSNTGYTLMAVIVKRVTGHTLREWTEANIFRPLGMVDTHFHDDHNMIVPNRTTGYAPRPGGGFRISNPVFDIVGATSLFTTVRDLARWDRNFYDQTVGGDVVDRMHTRGVLDTGDTLRYAFALSMGEYRGLRTVGHSGSDAGYRAYFVRFPDERMSFAVLCNVPANPGALAMRVAEIYLEDRLGPAPEVRTAAARPAERGDAAADNRGAGPTAAELAAYAGSYYSEELDVTYALVGDGGRIVLRRRKFDDRALEVAGPDRLRAGGWTLEFSRDEQGRIDGFRLNAGRVRNLRFARTGG